MVEVYCKRTSRRQPASAERLVGTRLIIDNINNDFMNQICQ